MQPYCERRDQLMVRMRDEGGGIAIIATAGEVMRNGDIEYPFRHDSYFHYLSGVIEPDAVMILVVGSRSRSILFCRDAEPDDALLHGARLGLEEARVRLGFDNAFPLAALDEMLPQLLAGASALYFTFGRYATADQRLHKAFDHVRRQARAGMRAPAIIRDLHMVLDDMRLIKTDCELETMREAAAISVAAHERAMRTTAPGCREYQIEAELNYEFQRRGATAPAYPAIVAVGANANALHHRPGKAAARDGDLVLVDAGCEYDSYACDITRTFPANGRFSASQRTLYEIVLEAQRAAIAAVQIGQHVMQPHEVARVLAQGMLDCGLLNRNAVGSLDDLIANRDYRRFFMGGTSHWIGMDVHDVGAYREPSNDGEWRKLRAGMTLTVEPGLYIRPAPDVPEPFWNIGIRIEDVVAVTPAGPDILTAGLPKSAGDIEALVQAR